MPWRWLCASAGHSLVPWECRGCWDQGDPSSLNLLLDLHLKLFQPQSTDQRRWKQHPNELVQPITTSLLTSGSGKHVWSKHK